MNEIILLKKNPLLTTLFSRPSFLNAEQEEELLQFLKKDAIDAFYTTAASLINNSYAVRHLYIYILSRAEERSIHNQHIMNHVCWRLFDLSHIGWLQLPDPEIIEYCKSHATDKELREEIKKIKYKRWLAEYLPYVSCEKKIEFGLRDLDTTVKKYLAFIKRLYEEKKIRHEEYDAVRALLKNNLQIHKKDLLIGSLISQELQGLLDIDVIAPQVAVLQIGEFKLLKQS